MGSQDEAKARDSNSLKTRRDQPQERKKVLEWLKGLEKSSSSPPAAREMQGTPGMAMTCFRRRDIEEGEPIPGEGVATVAETSTKLLFIHKCLLKTCCLTGLHWLLRRIQKHSKALALRSCLSHRVL